MQPAHSFRHWILPLLHLCSLFFFLNFLNAYMICYIVNQVYTARAAGVINHTQMRDFRTQIIVVNGVSIWILRRWLLPGPASYALQARFGRWLRLRQSWGGALRWALHARPHELVPIGARVNG